MPSARSPIIGLVKARMRMQRPSRRHLEITNFIALQQMLLFTELAASSSSVSGATAYETM